MTTDGEKLAAITALAERWAHQPNDYDEDTEQQIAAGHLASCPEGGVNP